MRFAEFALAGRFVAGQPRQLGTLDVEEGVVALRARHLEPGVGLRDPANPGKTHCGFNYAGDCADYTLQLPSPYACGTFDAAQGTYGDCHDRSGIGKWPDASKYREVITTYVGG
jgi:hypothetical protein